MASRLETLPAAVAPVFVGLSYAFHSGNFNFIVAFFTLFASILIQIGTNFANDVFDFEKGTDTEERLGLTRVTQAGLLSPKQVKNAMIYTFFLSLLVGIYLSFVGGWLIVLIGSLAIISGIMYTGGPFPLGYNGLGDIFVIIFFGVLAVPGTIHLQGGDFFNITGLVIGVIMGLMADCILIVNNIRDSEIDIKTGKRTLAVIFGKKASKLQYLTFALIPFILPIVIFFTAIPKISIFLVFFSFPICVKNIIDIWTKSGKSLNPVLANTARLQFFYTILLSLGIII